LFGTTAGAAMLLQSFLARSRQTYQQCMRWLHVQNCCLCLVPMHADSAQELLASAAAAAAAVTVETLTSLLLPRVWQHHCR
jgi:hydrogenase-4 membrane subunit HyfE